MEHNDKLELIEFLRANLKVEIKHKWATTYEHASVEVALILDGEVISESEATIYE